MPVTLTTLFTTPQDVWDVLSTEGVDLRQDDHNLGTGQLVTVSADAAAGATTLSVSAIPVALLRGAQLTFDGSAMTTPVVASLTAAASVGSTSLSVQALSSAVPAAAQARDSGVNAATGARLLIAARKGTSKVKFYCNQRYDDSELAKSGTVCDWATDIAVWWMCRRRVQSVPKSVQAAFDMALEEMRQVQSSELSIEDIGTRGSDWPTVTNVTVRPSYDGMQSRVEPAISEQSPTAFGSYIDWNSAMSLWL